MVSNASIKLARLIAQGVISLAAIGVGAYLCAGVPELRIWGSGLIGMVCGYWMR